MACADTLQNIDDTTGGEGCPIALVTSPRKGCYEMATVVATS
jgi:hypothetical protein